MAGTVSSVVLSHRSRGIVKLRVHIVVDASGVATAAPVGAVFGKLVAVGYKPGTLDTGADITVTDTLTGATIFSLTDAGTSPRYFRPTKDITGENGVAVTDGANNPNTNRDLYVNGKTTVAVAQGGVSTEGDLYLVVDEDILGGPGLVL